MNNRLQCNRNSSCHEHGSMACGESMNCDPLQMLPLAMGYVPWQQWQNVYEGSKGLEYGTIFEELIFPFQYASKVCGNMGDCRGGNRMERVPMERRYAMRNCPRERMPYERIEQGRCMDGCERMEIREQMDSCNRRETCERTDRCERRCD